MKEMSLHKSNSDNHKKNISVKWPQTSELL